MQTTKDEKNRKKVLTKGRLGAIIIKLSHGKREQSSENKKFKSPKESTVKSIIQKQFKINLLTVN